MNWEDKRDLDDQSYSVFLNSDEPVFIVNKKGGITEVNDAFCKKLGCTRNEILGTALQDSSFLTEDSRKQVMRRQLAKLIGKEAPLYSLDVKTNDGDILSFEIET